MKSVQIIDATFVPVPLQRNGREDNALIKQGAIPVEWGKNPAKLAHKDTDARWTKKGGQSHYGYKNHINIDRDTKLGTGSVQQREVTDTRTGRAYVWRGRE